MSLNHKPALANLAFPKQADYLRTPVIATTVDSNTTVGKNDDNAAVGLAALSKDDS